MIVYALFEVGLHGLDVQSEAELMRMREELATAIERVAMRYADPRRGRLVGDVTIDLAECAGEPAPASGS